MRRLLIVRHGKSVWNQESKFTGWTNIPLNKTGKLEAENMGKILNKLNFNPSIIYSSTLYRAIDTSTIINNNLNEKAFLHSDWRLNEKHYGMLEGVKRQNIRDLYGEEFTKKMRTDYNMLPPIIHPIMNNHYNTVKMCKDAQNYFNKIQLGECKKDVYKRVLPFFYEKIIPCIESNNFPLIVTHKHTARVLMKHLKNISDDDFENYNLPENKIIYLELDKNMKEKSYELISYA